MNILLKMSMFFVVIFSVNCFAASEISCGPMPIKVQDNNIMLNGPIKPRANPLIYFFKNNSKQSIWLDHHSERASANAGWSSYLHADNWSALLLNQKTFSVNCNLIGPGKVETLDCAKVVVVCAPKQELVIKRKGTFWLAEDQSWEELVKTLKKRGVQIQHPQDKK